jgi:hypothetical protein
MLTESLKKLIIKKYYNKKEDIENKLNIFYAMNKINDEEYIELTMLVENTYTEPVENIEATEVAEGEE